jgi:oligopeptide/dipeptide ABC transporter ATP-binding protein
VLSDPRHPYTRILSRAFPRTGDPASRLAPAGLPGEPPDLRQDLAGCPFAPRCPEAIPECVTHEIQLWPAGPQRGSACIKVLDQPGWQDPGEVVRQASGVSAAPALAGSPQAPPPEPVSHHVPGAASVLEARNLRVMFPARRGRGPARAVDDVNLALRQGEILALIGESGCGKSTLARALVGLVRPTSGEVRYEGTALRHSSAALREHRRHVQLVLQDPAGALNPRQNVFDAVAEGLRLHGIRAGLTDRVHEALTQAGLRPPEQYIARYPHELSGGQQQRVVIAGALALGPSAIVADEPVSSLDASVRGEILKLILTLRDQLSLAALIVSHDLGVAWNIADRVAVMYLGRIVEAGPVSEVLLRPRHPYTQALISVLPDGRRERPGRTLSGEPPDPTAIPPGCRFHPRCPRLASLPAGDSRAELCRAKPVPVLPATAEEGTAASLAACHLVSLSQSSVTEPDHPSPQGARSCWTS